MSIEKKYYDLLDEIRGKTIAVIYIYEGEDANGFKHYDIWKSNLISCWLNAIQELQCIPYIMDVRTFIFKVANNTLPHIDYIINMNAGCMNLSTLGLVPSACGFINIDCIPCNTSTIIAGENKSLANMIAKSLGFNVPDEKFDIKGIYRPLNYGSSKGIQLIDHPQISNNENGISQEFITGYDVTIPFIYNPITDYMEPLPAIFYLPDNNTPLWFFDAKSKETNKGFRRIVMPNISQDLIKKQLNLINKIGIDIYCRIDFRLKTKDIITLETLSKIELNKHNAYFIEINPMPTIEIGNNFYISFENITESNPFYETKSLYFKKIKNASTHGFILSCALIKKIISKH